MFLNGHTTHMWRLPDGYTVQQVRTPVKMVFTHRLSTPLLLMWKLE